MAVVTPIRPSHVASRSPRQASRVTTGYSMFVEGGDGRSAWARRWKDLILAHVTDLGGPKGLSEAEISLIRRASAMEIELEAMEARKSEGQKIDFGLYSRLTALLCRMLELVGIKRLTAPLDPQAELIKALEGYAGQPIDDDDSDEPLPIEGET
jgi:hypothetical protein